MKRSTRPILWLALVLLFLAHNDLWLWDDPGLSFGLPVGLTYHIAYSLAASVLMLLLARFAWPTGLEGEDEDGPR